MKLSFRLVQDWTRSAQHGQEQPPWVWCLEVSATLQPSRWWRNRWIGLHPDLGLWSSKEQRKLRETKLGWRPGGSASGSGSSSPPSRCAYFKEEAKYGNNKKWKNVLRYAMTSFPQMTQKRHLTMKYSAIRYHSTLSESDDSFSSYI